MNFKPFAIIIILLAILVSGANAETEAHSDDHFITACSQNLGRYGEKTKKQNDEQRRKQLGYLVNRMREAECDVVAVQEVVGENKREALERLQEIAVALSARTNRKFTAIVGDGRDKFIRNGYLIDEQTFKIKETVSYNQIMLPRYRPLAPPNFFERAPLGVLLEQINSARPLKKIFLINNHFKSKAFGHKDASGLDFELIRMQEAEAVRLIIEKQLTKEQSDAVVVLLGDRNSGTESASSSIIEGEYLLKDFMSESCSVEKNGHPKCDQKGAENRIIRGLFEYREQQFPGKFRGGSYRYRGNEEYLDEIFVRSSELERVTDNRHRVRIGTEGDYFRGSDHKLVWAEIELNSW